MAGDTKRRGNFERIKEYFEQGRRNARTPAEKEKFNVWDNFFKDVLPVLEQMKARGWVWYKNQQCKYIDVRIDMRDGGCIIRDREGNRINPEDLAYQIK